MMETLSSISGHGRFLSWFRNFREGREQRRKKEGGGCDGKERKARVSRRRVGGGLKVEGRAPGHHIHPPVDVDTADVLPYRRKRTCASSWS